MADQNIIGCLRQSDGKVIFTDTKCDDLVMPACINASGELYVYHESCDGHNGSDGWYQACLNGSGQLQIAVPEDCCYSWWPFGTGMNGHVWVLADWGGGLVAGGFFTTAGGIPVIGLRIGMVIHGGLSVGG